MQSISVETSEPDYTTTSIIYRCCGDIEWTINSKMVNAFPGKLIQHMTSSHVSGNSITVLARAVTGGVR